MPWENRDVMTMKDEFISRAFSANANFSKLCQEFKISRKTGYKWINRFKSEGVLGLNDRSKRPNTSPDKISSATIDLILELQKVYPAWGGRKLRKVLLNQGYQDLPCEKTFNRLLVKDKDHYTQKQTKACIRFERSQPNELWQMDFKGHFQIQEGRCHPLTILDDHSRFSVCLKACLAENEENVRTALELCFRQYGLPDAMTMDNGPPWRGAHPFRLSRLTVWLMRLGIKVSHSRPYHPQTQGKDERFHRTLKEEVLKFYQFKDLLDIQQRFDEWRQLYNCVRPHEGINLECPSQRYRSSTKPFIERLAPIEYAFADEVRRVGPCGTISIKGKSYFVGEHLYKEYVGLTEKQDGIIDIYFANTKIKTINLRQ